MRPSSRLITLWVIVILLVLFITISAKQLDEGLAWLTPVSALVVAIAVGVSLLDWLVSKRSLSLNISRTMPDRFSVGRAHDIELSIVPKTRLKRPVKVVIYDLYPNTWRVSHRELHLDLMPDRGTLTQYQATPVLRGDAEFLGTQYSVSSHLGLWQIFKRIDAKTSVKVLPDFSRILGANLIGLQRWLELMGAKRIRRHGQGQDFHQLRDYTDGDNIRDIDWKATSKMHKLITRTYQEERDQQLIFLLDCGRNMRTLSGDLSHFDHALNAMLLLSYTALKHDDAVGLITFNHPNMRYMPPRKGTAHLSRLVNTVYDVQPTQMAADYETAVNQLLQRQQRRALVVVLTQLDQEDNQHLLTQLQRLKKRFAVLIASLKQVERDHIQQHPMQSLDDAHAYVGAQMYAAQEQQMLRKLTAQRVLHLNVNPQQLSTALINQYLELKRHGSW